MGDLIIVDKITFLAFIAILYLKLRYKKLKIICATLPSKKLFFSFFENYLLRHSDITFVSYQHLDLHGINIPEMLIERFGELKDNINERSYICCERFFNDEFIKFRSYKNILNFSENNEKINNFLKKEFLVHYCRKYINLFECARLLAAESKDYSQISLILTGEYFDLWEIYRREFAPFSIPVKILLKRIHNFIDKALCVLAGPPISALILYNSFKRISFRRRLNITKNKKIIWIESGLSYNLLADLFKESSHFHSPFFIQDALFILEGSDVGGMEKYCLERNIELIIPEKVPVDLIYFFKRILGNICILFIGKQMVSSLLGEGKLFFWKENHSLIKNIINYESLCRIYSVKVFLIPRHYEQQNALKTIVINKYGGTTVSFQIGDIVHPCFNVFIYAYCTANKFFLYGEGSGEFKKYGQLIDEFYVVGSERVVRLKEQREVLRNKFLLNEHFVVTVFSPAYNETSSRRRNVLKFYDAISFSFSELSDRDIIFIIKVHKKNDMAEEERDFPELANLLVPIRRHKKFRYYYYENTYELMSVADFVIVWSASTTGIESIAMGKKTVFFDPMKSRFHSYKVYHNKIVVNNREDLRDLVKSAVEKRFPISDDIYDEIRRRHCYPNDGNSIQRILDNLSNIANFRGVYQGENKL